MGNFHFFYRYLGNKIWIAFALSVAVSTLDAFGLSMFLPLLQMVENSAGTADPESMGNLSFLVEGIQALGFDLTLGFVLLFMLIFFFFKAIFSYLSMVYIIVLQQRFVRSIRLNLLSALNRIGYKTFVTSDAGRIQNTLSGEVDRVSQSYLTYFGAFQQGIMVVVYMGFAFFLNFQFAVLISIGGALTNVIYKTIYKHTKGASRKLTFSTNIYQGQIIQHVGNFKYLKATGLVNQYGDLLRATINKIEDSRKRIGVLSSIGLAAREPLLVAVVAAVILIQTRVLGGGMGTIIASLLLFYRALTALVAMQQSWNSFMSTSGSLENMKSFEAELLEAREQDGTQEFSTLNSTIAAEAVSFSYGSTSILKDISIRIQKNETVAFVGESGSGKTTLVNLLAGLLPPDSGQVMADGVSVSSLKKASYQRRIGYITQDPVIFNDTVFNNVTFWAEPTQENIARFELAIRQASLSEFLETLPDGPQALLGNNGINLSGGQKQRISIARELYKDIDILIMDEATSALDSETEQLIQQSVEALKGKYTILVVAHRLSTIKSADRVVFLNKGEIEDEGTFSELMQKVPRFRKMVELQEI